MAVRTTYCSDEGEGVKTIKESGERRKVEEWSEIVGYQGKLSF